MPYLLFAGVLRAEEADFSMWLAQYRRSNRERPGDHGQGTWRHDIFAVVFYGGRRRGVFARLVAESGARPGDRVLDVGCGAGYFTRLMGRAVVPGGTAHGVDSSARAIAQAQQLTRLTNCTFSEGNAEALDAPDGAHDVVVSSLMIHHLPGPRRAAAIREMFRVLRPGGSLLIAEFRPPTSQVGRRLIRAHSPAMAENRVDLIEPMVREAGFERVRSGDLRPWVHYVQALKPMRAAPSTGETTAAVHITGGDERDVPERTTSA